MTARSVSRRSLFALGGAAAIVTAGVGLPWGEDAQTKSASKLADKRMPRPYAQAFRRPPVLAPRTVTTGADGAPLRTYSLTERAGTAEIAPGISTPVYGYNGSLPGPTVSLDAGTRSMLRVRNQLPAVHPSLGHDFHTSTHLHGSASKPQYDGYASDITPPGYYKDYYYPNFQAARTLWYHDHGVHYTAQNAYSGLAAQYHLHDEAERALLPQDEYDVPLTLSDVMFAADGALAYDDNSHSGLWGDVILVNGVPWPVMKVKRRVYRFRVLNASISRSYRPQLSTGDPLTVVATDGGLIPVAQQVLNYRHGNAERYEILIDFRRYKPGQRVELRNLSNDNNRDYDHTGKIMAFDVTDEPILDTSRNTIPTLLVSSPVMALTAAQAKRTRKLRVERGNGEWQINGKTWRDVVDSGYQMVLANPDYNDVEIWEIENKSGGWFHPVHIHLVDFQILSRNGKAPFAWEKGPKDVVYVGENEAVRLIMRFEHQRGKYMIHCHNLPHEDHDMMQQFSVGLAAGAPDPDDPINADPCRPDALGPDA
ncbi:multicopper oxidase family protein [Catenuloplanes japonicus]|uniref:multicopper oxidase family protein n=1 Tax=Catenuloplanes japonicus TaxID=33876 RepID=UPI000524E452|nr:multicopper oxidase domain-containing protein [Catenuloplanes japonicus]